VNQSQIYTLARNAGLTDTRAKVAAAIAMAESGGNEKSHNATPPDDSYGLWQINMLGSLGPARRALYNLTANTDLYDPTVNARVMSAMSSQGQNFRPWTTYTRGTYKQYINNPVSTVAVNLPDGATTDALLTGAGIFTNPLGAIKDTTDAARTAASLLVKSAAWTSNPNNWLRIVYVIGGSVAAIAGIVTVVKSTDAGRAAISAGKKTAATARKVGAVATKVGEVAAV
jgi:hypothetical protein